MLVKVMSRVVMQILTLLLSSLALWDRPRVHAKMEAVDKKTENQDTATYMYIITNTQALNMYQWDSLMSPCPAGACDSDG